MPEIRRYKKNSIIYFEGDGKGRSAYLLKEGQCLRRKMAAGTGEYEASFISVGEFFGTKSALGLFRRDETVEVKEDSVVYMFSPAEFEAILKKNPSLIFKILRLYSNELRLMHRAMETILRGEAQGATSHHENIRELGDYYYKKGAYLKCLYAYRKYLEIVPTSPLKTSIEEQILKAQEQINTEHAKV